MTDVRHKETICATVSPYLKKQVEKLVASNDFSSMSDLVNIALTRFINEYKLEQAQEKQTGHNDQHHIITKNVTFE